MNISINAVVNVLLANDDVENYKIEALSFERAVEELYSLERLIEKKKVEQENRLEDTNE